MRFINKKEFKEYTLGVLRDFKDNVASAAQSVKAQDILPADSNLLSVDSLKATTGPALIASFGLPLIGFYLARKKHESPLARNIAKFLGVDVNSINEENVFNKLSQ